VVVVSGHQKPVPAGIRVKNMTSGNSLTPNVCPDTEKHQCQYQRKTDHTARNIKITHDVHPLHEWSVRQTTLVAGHQRNLHRNNACLPEPPKTPQSENDRICLIC
jgi:hypothetical protein